MTQRNRVRQNCQESPSAESASSEWTPWSVVYVWKIIGAISPLHHLVKISSYTTSKPEKMQNPQSISCTHSLGYLLPNLSKNVSIFNSAPHLFNMAPTSFQCKHAVGGFARFCPKIGASSWEKTVRDSVGASSTKPHQGALWTETRQEAAGGSLLPAPCMWEPLHQP